jgi:hypothetical protein
MRLFALACVAVPAMLAFAATPARAIAPGKAAVGSEILTRVDGRPSLRRYGHLTGHRYRYRHTHRHHHRGFYRNGYDLMYAVHSYPRGIVATFGYPRDCYCH